MCNYGNVLYNHLIHIVEMKGLTIFLRTTKKEGTIRLRFRLRDGREVDLYHKSEIRADLSDIEKFTPEGEVKPRVSLYNKRLKNDIDVEMSAIIAAYGKLCKKKEKRFITNVEFEKTISEELNPDKAKTLSEVTDIYHRFERYIEEGCTDGIFGKARQRHYKVLLNELKRFLIISKLTSLPPADFTGDMLIDFRRFLIDEYTFVEEYPKLYQAEDVRNIPKERRSQNTVVTKLRELQAFYNELIARGEIEKSPFALVGKHRKRIMMREQYDAPVCLTLEEFEKILNKSDVPATLKETRDCFLLQCAFGCRISDYKQFSMKKIGTSEDGIPFIHYVPQKTIKNDREEVVTPILRYAMDIIKEYQFNFGILKYVSGHQGYNAKIKSLLKFCDIDRPVSYYDIDSNDMKERPLYEAGCSKLARKTFVDLINKMQINMYLGGLHKQGSDAVKRYTNIGLKERFMLYSVAFNQPIYKVDNELNIINEGEL